MCSSHGSDLESTDVEHEGKSVSRPFSPLVYCKREGNPHPGINVLLNADSARVASVVRLA